MSSILIFCGGVVACMVACVVVAELLYALYRWIQRCCVWHARRYCVQQGLLLSKSRCSVAFGWGGWVEYAIVELDCVGPRGERRYIRLAVWLLGEVRLQSDEAFPALLPQAAGGWPPVMNAAAEGSLALLESDSSTHHGAVSMKHTAGAVSTPPREARVQDA